MKPFDLEKALAGEPVVLRNGRKAVICGRVPDSYTYEGNTKVTFPLFGITLNKDNTIDNQCVTWRDDGRLATGKDGMDILGMWDEPKLTTEEIMEKAFQARLVLKHSLLPTEHIGFTVVGKTVDNQYILQSCNDQEMYFSVEFGEDIEWSIKN